MKERVDFMETEKEEDPNPHTVPSDSDKADHCPDDRFTRNVRPASVLGMLLFFIFIVLADGNMGHFKVTPGYYPILETVLATMVIAYFGSRGFEKSVKSWERGNYYKDRHSSRTRNFRPDSSRFEEEDYGYD